MKNEGNIQLLMECGLAQRSLYGTPDFTEPVAACWPAAAGFCGPIFDVAAVPVIAPTPAVVAAAVGVSPAAFAAATAAAVVAAVGGGPGPAPAAVVTAAAVTAAAAAAAETGWLTLQTS